MPHETNYVAAPATDNINAETVTATLGSLEERLGPVVGGAPVIVKYEKPDVVGDKARLLVPLCRTDLMASMIQVIRQGGENKLHSHARVDGFFFVLAGRVRFYADGDRIISECGQYEGVLIPRGVKYWFESRGDDDAELLQVEARNSSARSLIEFFH